MKGTIIEWLQSRGIQRRGSKRSGFHYRGPEGTPVTGKDRERIDALRIPPAWRSVAIHPSASGTVQVVGLDAAGRWQYRYHRAHIEKRERRRRERLIRFTGALPRMRRVIASALALPGMSKEKVLAGILRILATCFLRPGSESYAEENGSYGIATLERRHVSVRADLVRFDFRGKSGRRQVCELRDQRLARLLRLLLRYPGEVFKYRSGDGRLVDIRRGHINAYIKANMGEAFSAKDFRTWAGSLLCACVLAREEPGGPFSEGERKRRVRAAIREVAGHLGNTPAVCRSSYVLPEIIQRYERGTVLEASFDHAGELVDGDRRRIERAERALLRLISANGSRRNGHETSRPVRRSESRRATLSA
jgi:DNA topoisomerase-1